MYVRHVWTLDSKRKNFLQCSLVHTVICGFIRDGGLECDGGVLVLAASAAGIICPSCKILRMEKTHYGHVDHRFAPVYISQTVEIMPEGSAAAHLDTNCQSACGGKCCGSLYNAAVAEDTAAKPRTLHVH